jgi:autoinducer 2-degrading protein
MHVTLVHVHVKSEHVDDFIAAARENHLGSVVEPGNLRFDILQQAGDPTRFVLYEVYATAEDAAAHKQTAHYLKWRDAVTDWMESPRRGVLHNLLYPETLKK